MTKRKTVVLGFITKEQGRAQREREKSDVRRTKRRRKVVTYFVDPLHALQLLQVLCKLAGHFGAEAVRGYLLSNKRLATVKHFDMDDDCPVDAEAEARRRLRRDLYRRIADGKFAGIADVIQLPHSASILANEKQRQLYLPERERPYDFTFKVRDVLPGLPTTDGGAAGELPSEDGGPTAEKSPA